MELRVRFVVLQLLTNCAELTAGFEISQASGQSRKRINRGEMAISGTNFDVASQSMFFLLLLLLLSRFSRVRLCATP